MLIHAGRNKKTNIYTYQLYDDLFFAIFLMLLAKGRALMFPSFRYFYCANV